jgi:hypothetical protein
MKTYVGVDVKLRVFLTLALVGGEWSTLRQGRFTTKEKATGALCIGGWVSSRAGLDDVEKCKFLTLACSACFECKAPLQSPVLLPISVH